MVQFSTAHGCKVRLNLEAVCEVILGYGMYMGVVFLCSSVFPDKYLHELLVKVHIMCVAYMIGCCCVLCRRLVCEQMGVACIQVDLWL